MVHGLQQIREMNNNACRIHEAKKLGIVDPGRREDSGRLTIVELDKLGRRQVSNEPDILE
jgi:hypothetical protein